MTTDLDIAESVRLAAIKDALDRSGALCEDAVRCRGFERTKPWNPFSKESPKLLLVQGNPRTKPALAIE